MSLSNAEQLIQGLSAPICLTWEMTYACNLSCLHCLSSSGERGDGELTTAEAKGLIDSWAKMKVFYINVGGGEPMSRTDFFELMDYSMKLGIGMKISTNGSYIDQAAVKWLQSRRFLDVQISLDGATENSNDLLRGKGSFANAMKAAERLSRGGVGFKISSVVTNLNLSELDEFYKMAKVHNAQLRLTRFRPTGRGRRVWDRLRLSHDQNSYLHAWLIGHEDVLTGDSFFYLSAYGKPLQGLDICGAGRIVCNVTPTGDVYPCPFLVHESYLAGNVLEAGGFEDVWRRSAVFMRMRRESLPLACHGCRAYAHCRGGCLAVKLATGRSWDSPDPDCPFDVGVPSEIPADALRSI